MSKEISRHYIRKMCRICQKEVEDQQHLLICEYLEKEEETFLESKYSDIFGTDSKKSYKITKILLVKIKTRENILNNIFES